MRTYYTLLRRATSASSSHSQESGDADTESEHGPPHPLPRDHDPTHRRHGVPRIPPGARSRIYPGSRNNRRSTLSRPLRTCAAPSCAWRHPIPHPRTCTYGARSSLWVDSQIFESPREKDRGELGVGESEARLEKFVRRSICQRAQRSSCPSTPRSNARSPAPRRCPESSSTSLTPVVDTCMGEDDLKALRETLVSSA
ncbi:hypothetical protein V8E36_000304 [Tilletia maclaganii]